MLRSATNRGFTLIELLVATAIGLVLTWGGLAAYRGAGEKESLKQAGLELQSDLRLIQKKALAGEKPDDCGNLSGYLVKPGRDLGEYVVQAECSNNNGPEITYDLPDNVLFGAAISEMTFQVLRQGVSGAQIITLVSELSDNYQYIVTVESGGTIMGRLDEAD